MRPILDLQLLNCSVMRLKFKMLTVKQVVSHIRSQDWFVTIDLKGAYFHVSILPSHRKFLRFAFRGKAYQYRVLPFGLALSPPYFHEACGCCTGSPATPGYQYTQLHQRLVDFSSFRADGGSTSKCRSRSYEIIGIKAKHQGKCDFSITEDHLSGHGVGFDHDAGTYVPCSDRVNPHISQESKRRLTHCQEVSKTTGSDGSCVQHNTFCPAVHKTHTVVAQDQGVLTLHDEGYVTMPTCLRHVEETLVLVSGPSAGSSLSPHNVSDGCIPYRLGSGHELPPCLRFVEWFTSHVAHQLPGDADCVSLCWGWMLWYRLGRGFVCTPFPRSLCSREY